MISALFRHCLLWLCSTALLLAPASVFADDEVRRRQAIEIGQTGIELYEQRNYGVALERFRTAERAVHSPVFALYAARCLAKLGRLTEAANAYEALATEALPADAAPAWRAALSDAAVERAELLRRVPSVRIVVSGEASAVTLDGAPLEPERVGSELRLNPGVHDVEMRDARGRVARTRFELEEGERRSVSLAFPAPTPPLPSCVPPVPAEPPVDVAADALGISLLSAGGAGLVAGVITGVLASGKLQDIRERCVGNRCLESDRTAGDSVDRLALVSTIGFAVGGASLGLWGVRVIMTPRSGQGGAASLPGAIHLSRAF